MTLFSKLSFGYVGGERSYDCQSQCHYYVFDAWREKIGFGVWRKVGWEYDEKKGQQI